MSNCPKVYSNCNLQAVLVAIAMLCLTAEAMPFNAVGTPFYDGNVARAPSFTIQEANPQWIGLATKVFTLGGGPH